MEPVVAVFTVSRMTCGGCVRHVQRAIAKLDGVSDSEVSIGRVRLSFAPDKLTREAIAAALAEAGYPAVPEP